MSGRKKRREGERILVNDIIFQIRDLNSFPNSMSFFLFIHYNFRICFPFRNNFINILTSFFENFVDELQCNNSEIEYLCRGIDRLEGGRRREIIIHLKRVATRNLRP